MSLKLVVTLSSPTEEIADYVRFANLLLEECASNPRFKEFAAGRGQDVTVKIEGIEPIVLEGFYMNEARKISINPSAVYVALAEKFKQMG